MLSACVLGAVNVLLLVRLTKIALLSCNTSSCQDGPDYFKSCFLPRQKIDTFLPKVQPFDKGTNENATV